MNRNPSINVEPPAHPPVDFDILDSDYQWAAEQVLADVDTFCDELAGAAMRTPRVTSDWFTRVPGRLAQADDLTLLHALLTAGQRNDADTALEAARMLGDRYLSREAERIARLASEYAADSMECER